MTKNNHFDKLDRLLRGQALDNLNCEYTSIYQYAETLARIESALVVVSDLTKGTSRLFSGEFAKRLGINSYSSENSIWEKEILALMTEQEREEKFIAELRFFHYLRHIPRKKRNEYFLLSKLRFKESLDVLHRMYYIHDESMDAVRYAICIYSLMIFDYPGKSFVINSVTGVKEELTSVADETIISKRERQILQLIASGKKSIEIADVLNISKNTVSRHRQEILAKLQVKNSIEACRIATSMGII
ncbi:MAG: LuxR C-terminal-related transcriptional regulator [Muribaculaceae bacterium]|nr:LuxR C-terminal-related transcriptional regulator [Muribaculaceae bacterium]MDE6755006.1 LuxR C-terminal-related transcriptional regulator [Muribaculaceae bacterium]